MQQKIPWAEVQKETGRWKNRRTVRGLLADGRCGQVVLDFLSSVGVGRLAPPLEESDAGSEVSEWSSGRAGSGKKRGRRRCRRWVPKASWTVGHNPHCSYPPPRSWHRRGRSEVGSAFSFVISLVRIISSWDRPGRRAKGELATSRHRADSGRENWTKCTPPALKKLTNGLSLQQRNRTPVGWNGCATWAGMKCVQYLPPDLLHTSSGRSRRSRWRRDNGPGPPRRSTQ